MRLSFATEATPGLENEDFVAAGQGWAVVLDGATAPSGVDSGCVHGPAWLARRLGAELAGRLAADGKPLPDVLAESIEAIGGLHGDCDLGNPDSPSATAAMVRWDGRAVEWLVLADSPVILDVDGELKVITDDRLDHLPSYTLEGVRASRNSPGGFWVASTRPEAAYEAVTGELPRESVRRVAVLSDGASRLVEKFAMLGWNDLLDLLDQAGPEELIRRTREAEKTAPATRRGKRYDDATALIVRL
ncbi:protein phosphatase 2C domain-containing protein [Spirillospora sp. CA-294931]|uniref:protein phosphatase 2C domain-containing protein n=1 Tax=Spirillospora sp. CA-294931 TaxID=3240042 RepID=UPI003D913072